MKKKIFIILAALTMLLSLSSFAFADPIDPPPMRDEHTTNSVVPDDIM